MTRSAPAGQIQLAGDGLRVLGTPLEIGFGRAAEGAIASASKLVGAGPVSSTRQTECGAGPMTAVRWDNGLTMNIQLGAFVGWTMSGAGASTADGLRVGQTRAEVAGRGLSPTTLGEEFTSAGVSGLVDSKQTVSLLFAGTTCFFR